MNARTIRVLCCDDHDIAVEGMRRILEHEPGIEVAGSVTHIDDIARLVHERQPDVVLLDLKWGGVFEAGYDIIRQIKERSPEVRIIAISAYEHLAEGAKNAGADEGVTKDISPRDLVARVKAAMVSLEWL